MFRYPVDEVADIAVDSWLVPESTSDPPASVPCQPPYISLLDHQGSSTVPLQETVSQVCACVHVRVCETWVTHVTHSNLTCVNSSPQLAGTDHGLSDRSIQHMSPVTGLSAVDGDLCLIEEVRRRS